MLKVLLVCGMSGAGKTTTQSALEDLGYMCIDNMPPTFISLVVDLVEKQDEATPKKIGFIFDIKYHSVNNIQTAYNELKDQRNEKKYQIELLFLDAEDNVLLGRYRETRRKHPLASATATLAEAVVKERQLMQKLKQNADVIVDTSQLNMKELTLRLTALFNEANELGIFNVMFMSFGFKHGIPLDADFVLDVRYLPNPFYDETMRLKTGKDALVYDFVLEGAEGVELYEKTMNYLTFLLSKYKKDKRNNFVIAFGCTGGQHRSVAFAEKFYQDFKKKYICFVQHRDMEKNKAEVIKRFEQNK
ncbi:MAG: RNase adapter RapZ [Culicoidibacterales bacterium]